MRKGLLGLLTTLALGVAAQSGLWMPSLAFGDEAFFAGLDDLPGGTFESRAFGVSSDGNVVVGYGFSDLGKEAFRWHAPAGSMEGLGVREGLTHCSRRALWVPWCPSKRATQCSWWEEANEYEIVL